MKLLYPRVEFVSMTPDPLKVIEDAGRTCYQSHDRKEEGSEKKFVEMVLKRGHESVIEHATASYRVICDRGVTHEIVRHRLFSYSQESTRYCAYKGHVQFIAPYWIAEHIKNIPFEMTMEELITTKYPREFIHVWLEGLLLAEHAYHNLMNNFGFTAQQARAVLPNALKTEIVITGNFREWRHFFKLRLAETAHPQMREVANMIWQNIRRKVPVVFSEFEADWVKDV